MRGGMSTHGKEAVESDDNNKGPNDGVGGRQRVPKQTKIWMLKK